MFLHLREKTKFIRCDRYNRFIFAISGKKTRRPTLVCASHLLPAFLYLPLSFYFLHSNRLSLRFSRVASADSTNFTDCSNFSQRKGRRRPITPLSGVASKQVDRMRLARRRRGSLRSLERFASAVLSANARNLTASACFLPNYR